MTGKFKPDRYKSNFNNRKILDRMSILEFLGVFLFVEAGKFKVDGYILVLIEFFGFFKEKTIGKLKADGYKKAFPFFFKRTKFR